MWFEKDPFGGRGNPGNGRPARARGKVFGEFLRELGPPVYPARLAKTEQSLEARVNPVDDLTAIRKVTTGLHRVGCGAAIAAYRRIERIAKM